MSTTRTSNEKKTGRLGILVGGGPDSMESGELVVFGTLVAVAGRVVGLGALVVVGAMAVRRSRRLGQRLNRPRLSSAC